MTLAEDQLKSFIGKFDAKTQTLIRATRRAMRKQLAAANGVSLMFLRGARLLDPHKLLQGTGKLNRSLKIKSATDLDRREVRSLISEAAAQAGLPLIAAGKPKLIIRSVSKKQRPRKRTTA